MGLVALPGNVIGADGLSVVLQKLHDCQQIILLHVINTVMRKC